MDEIWMEYGWNMDGIFFYGIQPIFQYSQVNKIFRTIFGKMLQYVFAMKKNFIFLLIFKYL